MRVAKYSTEHGCTSGCSLRMSEACNQPVAAGQNRALKGGSWFGHVRLADNLGQQGARAMLQIKTGHALYPAKFMEEKIKGGPRRLLDYHEREGPPRHRLIVQWLQVQHQTGAEV
jgi:hypothetical protein